MSDFLNHECGIAFLRLKKPLSYYQDSYGSCLWGFHKLFLLMEKQFNRGQDGSGIGCVKLNMPFGKPYLSRRREIGNQGLGNIFKKEMEILTQMEERKLLEKNDPDSMKSKFDFAGEILLGHLRYGTSGGFNKSSCHPYLRMSNWPTRTLMLAGNFNMTNVQHLNQKLIQRGQHPIFTTDTQTVLEEIGFHLDEMHTDIYRRMRKENVDNQLIPEKIALQMDISEVLRKSSEDWDGGYVIAGITGSGYSFLLRDPFAIRPCYILETEDYIAAASERVALMTVFNASVEQISSPSPGSVTVINLKGEMKETQLFAKEEKKSCSFERIYFSRPNDPEIYQERKKMGANLVPQVMEQIGNSLENVIFSFIPNTAEIACGGLIDKIEEVSKSQLKKNILEELEKGNLDEGSLDEIFSQKKVRIDKIAYKDIKLRTFISQEQARNQLASYVYDVTYGVIRPEDSLIVVDDSIVRGTTLKTSILEILARTNPKKIIICSTAPQIRYPDCYGIDMSEIGKLIAFQAAVNLRKKAGEQSLLERIYQNSLKENQKDLEKDQINNAISSVYQGLGMEKISEEISKILYPDCDWKGELRIIYQTVENLHSALTDEGYGDWYFTGKYPTQGGNHLVNQSYINWYEGKHGRAYDLPLNLN